MNLMTKEEWLGTTTNFFEKVDEIENQGYYQSLSGDEGSLQNKEYDIDISLTQSKMRDDDPFFGISRHSNFLFMIRIFDTVEESAEYHKENFLYRNELTRMNFSNPNSVFYRGERSLL